MARSQRVDVPGGWHHVYNRGADRQDIFSDDGDRLRFEQLFVESAEHTATEIHAYCQMTNHFHGLVHCPAGGLSTMLQRLQGSYASWYNQRHERSGPVFGGRFGSTLVTSDQQLLGTSRYVHLNPVDIVPVRALAAYRWSSYGCYVGTRATPPWLHTAHVLAAFGGDRSRYRLFVETDAPAPEAHSAVPRPTLEEIVTAVIAGAGVDDEMIRSDLRGVRNDARTLVAMLALSLRAGSSQRVAEVLGTNSAATARTLARRGRVLTVRDEDFRRLEERVRRLLAARR